MTGVVMALPRRVWVMMSKSVSRGAAELQTGTLIWTRPGNFSFMFSTTLLRLRISFTSFSDSFLLISTTFSLPPLPAILFSHSSRNFTSVAFAECEKRIAGNGGKLKVVDINKKESEKEVKEILSLSKVVENMKEKFPAP